MSQNYLVLARKYRPINFAQLKGQDFLVTTLVNAIRLERVAHSFLLTGIRGGGKTTTARIIAKTLNCSAPTITEELVLPCGICANCLASVNDKHPDIIELDAASRTGVDDMREIIENANYSPLLGKYKIYIIDEVHMLSTSAFNALLKTLEEPPSHVKFIFATTELRKIPITILSRCQKFELRRLNTQELVAHLQDILAQENISADLDALQLIAAHAEGSVRDSLSLLDLIISNANNTQISQNHVKNLLGFSEHSLILDLFDAVVKGDSARGIDSIKQFYYAGKDLLYVMQQMMELVHNISKHKLDAGGLLLEYSQEDMQQLNELASKLDIASLTILWQMLLKGMQEMQLTHNLLMSAEMLVIRMCHLSNIPTPAEMIKKFDSGELKSIPALAHTPTLKQDDPSINVSKAVINNFEELVQLFHQHRELLIYEYLVNDISLVEFAPLKLKIQQSSNVPRNFTNKVAALLQEYTGDQWNIIVTTDGVAEPTISAQVNEAKIQQIEELSQDPLVKGILQSFPTATIKDIA